MIGEKVTRYLSRSCDVSETREVDNTVADTYESVSVISSSTITIGKEKLFSSEECTLLRELCKEVISKPSISIDRIEQALKKSKEGVVMLDKFSSKQIQNRLKYERRTLLRWIFYLLVICIFIVYHWNNVRVHGNNNFQKINFSIFKHVSFAVVDFKSEDKIWWRTYKIKMLIVVK